MPSHIRPKKLIYFFLWCALFLFTASRHIPWRDEFQAWLVSTRTSTWSEFFEAIRYERQPPFLYLLQRAAFSLASELKDWGLAVEPWNPIWFQTLSWSFSIGLVAILLFCFELPWILWASLPLGILFLLDYGIIARAYGMGAFFLFAGAALKSRGRRKSYWVSLLLAGSTHLYFTSIAGWLFLFDLGESWRKRLSRREIGAAALIVLGFAGLVLFQRPPHDSTFAKGLNFADFKIQYVFQAIAYGLTGFDGASGPFVWNRAGLGWPVGLILTAFLCMERKKGFPVGKFFLLIAAPLAVMSMAYAPSLRHVGVLWFAAWTLILLNGENWDGKCLRVPKTFYVLSLFMVFASLRWLSSWKPWQPKPEFAFSGYRELQSVVGPELQKPDAILINCSEQVFFPVMSSLNIEIYDVARRKFLRYPYFRAGEVVTTIEEWCKDKGWKELRARYPHATLYFGIQKGRYLPEGCVQTALVFESRETHTVSGEEYSIYRILE